MKNPCKSWDVQLPTSTDRPFFSRYFSFSSMRTPEGKKVGNLSLKGFQKVGGHPQAFNVWYIYPHFGDFCMVNVGKYTIS